MVRAALLLTFCSGILQAQQLHPHTLALSKQKQITLSLPPRLTIDLAATGLHCPRFFAVSPDHRIFVADLYDRSDNTKGALYILDNWDPATHRFLRVIPYLQNLRNPNNLAFYTEPAKEGRPAQTWLYTALTDKLIRFRYQLGDTHPGSAPEVLAHYPDYGLSYKYGGWHLTRTVAVAQLHGKTRIFITVGSSCNACLEKEPIRASLSVMDPDGSNQQILATGLRNAVDLRYIPEVDGGALFGTNMGADHLGDRSPEDTFFEFDSNGHPGPANGLEITSYGWPTCYFLGGMAHPDGTISNPKLGERMVNAQPGPAPPQLDCSRVSPPYTTFAAHSSPLGLEFFGAQNTLLANTFLVALHGASHLRIGSGYRVVRFSGTHRRPENFITGFVTEHNGRASVRGRPCGLLRVGPDSFLLSDDVNGAVYFIHPAA